MTEPRATGRYLIYFEQEAPKSEIQEAVRDITGLAAGYGGQYGAAALVSGGVAAIERFHVGVIEERNDGYISALEASDVVKKVRPEYWMFPPSQKKQWLRDAIEIAAEACLRDEESYEKVEAESTATISRLYDTAAMTWGLTAIRADKAACTGQGVKVGVLDTGFDSSHPDFANRQINYRSFIIGEDAQDGNGHGTHVAGTISGPLKSSIGRRYGCAPNVDLYIGKVLSNRGYGSEFGVLEGMDWAIRERCAVINMSLGRAVRQGEAPDPLYESVGNIALDAGCLVIAAAGNESDRPYYTAPVGSPANAKTIMAVGAVDSSSRVCWFSCGAINPGGGEVDICAPGSSIYSAYPVPRLSYIANGTSMACPHVAGVAAMLAQQDSNLRGLALWEALVKTSKPLGNTSDFGAGLVQCPLPRTIC